MSPRTVIPVENGALSPIAERVLDVESLTHDHGRRRHRDRGPRRTGRAPRRAERLGQPRRWSRSPSPLGTSRRCSGPRDRSWCVRTASRGESSSPDYEPDPDGPLSQVEIWRLKDPTLATRSTSHAGCARSCEDERVRTHRGDELRPAGGLTPPRADPVPVGRRLPRRPAQPAPEPDEPFVQPPSGEAAAKVTILDSGYIWLDPDRSTLAPQPRRARDRRPGSVAGHRRPERWKHGQARRPVHRFGRPARRDLRARHVHRRADLAHRSATRGSRSSGCATRRSRSDL